MEVEDEYHCGGRDIEPDSDVDDTDSESQLSQWLGELENYAKGLEPGDTSTVRRRQKTVVTPKMAMESFRYSFLSEDQDVNLDAILGELSELETQLGTGTSDFSPLHHGNCLSPGLMKDEHRDSGNDLAQSELDALASEITRSLGFKNKRPMGDLDYFQTHYPGDLGGYSDAMLDIAETDSAFSESASLPSSESFTSMVTVSSAADTSGMGDTGLLHHSLHCDSMCPCLRFTSTSTNHVCMRYESPWHEIVARAPHQHEPVEQHVHQEQKAIIQAEKIRIALDKIREAKIKKLFVRAFASDGSSKSIMVDEKMTILEVIAILADKNHVRLNPDLAVIEHMPELFMERVLEDHDSLVENMVMWTRDTKNQILFEARQYKNDLFKTPERYLLVPSSSEKGASLDPKRRENLIQEFFADDGVSKVPEVEGVLYLKSDGKKAWKKFFFVLRASGLYYNPKGKISKSSKDLTCLVQFEYVELYQGFSWKKKHHSPTDYCFALKHPQIQKKTSKFIRYLCAENKAALDQWIMGIRIAKCGKQLLTNFHNLHREIIDWDTRDIRTSITDQRDACEVIAELNQEGDLHDSRLSMPEPGSRHSIIVKNSMLIPDTVNIRNSEDIVHLEIERTLSKTPERKSSLTNVPLQDPVKLDKVPVKRVSFSTTHCVINDSGEEVVPVRHRDSITSASTDSSEDSTSSGEGRMSGLTGSHRSSKLRAKIPVTTGTTRQISEMVQTSMDGGSIGSFDESLEDWKPSVSSPVQKEINERRKSAPACNDIYCTRKVEGRDHSRSMSQTIQYDQLPMSPNSQQQYRGQGQVAGSTRVMSPSCQKGYQKSHSRGSSISSCESSDSYPGQVQGHLVSPTSPSAAYGYPEYYHNQSNLPLYETIESANSRIQMSGQGQTYVGQGQNINIKQAPPTAQKPLGTKKTRPQSSPVTGPLEKGHKRNTSKSSLESVEEEKTKGPIPVMSPVPHRAMMSPPPQPPKGQGQNKDMYNRPQSQPGTPPAMSMSAPNFSNANQSQSLQQKAHPILSPLVMHQSTPGSSSNPQSPASATISSPQPMQGQGHSGCMSPRLSTHRVSGPKPVPPPVVPCTPPTPPQLVPPAPRNTANPVKTHKKRPSGGNIVVNGNQVMSKTQGGTYPDIVTSQRSPSIMGADYPTCVPGSPLPDQGQGYIQGQGQCMNSNEDTNYASLPFMAELNKHMHKPPNAGGSVSQNTAQHLDTRCPPETLPKPSDTRHKTNGNHIASSQNEYNSPSLSMSSSSSNQTPVNNYPSHNNTSMSHSADSVTHKQSLQQSQQKRQLPPPPPKRSERTRLSSSQLQNTPPSAADTSCVPNESIYNDVQQNDLQNIDPIYDNCEGIVDINDLPPPPPELLSDFEGQGEGHVNVGQPGSKVKPPPPPPKRNRETHLSTSSTS